MAKDNSFDIVSEIDMQELDNAIQQAKREVKTRYDLKDSGSDVDFDKSNNQVHLSAPSDFVCNQVKDIVQSKCVKRNVDLKALNWGNIEPAAGATVKLDASIVSGIDKEIAKKINKDIKDKKLKVKTQIEGEKIRVSSPKRDTLQEVIQFLKEKDYGLPLQYVNYR
ncbi:MAG: YajQ family cyclic di-GMP-binding protein [Coriobacteriia bacterium]|nr:YajQ family cyclic di-GMP-binding protein [Coriobacteriia bacterium]